MCAVTGQGSLRQAWKRRYESFRWRPIERRSDHLVLQPLKTGDRQDFFDSIDEDVMRWQGYSTEYVESLRKHFPNNPGYWDWSCAVAVRDRSTDEFVASYSVEDINAAGGRYYNAAATANYFAGLTVNFNKAAKK